MKFAMAAMRDREANCSKASCSLADSFSQGHMSTVGHGLHMIHKLCPTSGAKDLQGSDGISKAHLADVDYAQLQGRRDVIRGIQQKSALTHDYDQHQSPGVHGCKKSRH
eukprot:gnl/TRDRNA2_/TRDRNA2_175685_c0_seq1.p1 gnl/TRDRNA2_/TRDRNA2_175685_c0~~gnl/TRDRNA2_/TRDRNA2_175685_c0_seq1.p1  ORF type:complete len:109 (+),score=7.54 gnl/TRDRNA2_/TRDRNA2_175685_c0_seq1:148-474(+)